MSRQIPTSWVLLACLLVPRITLAELAPAARTVVDRYVEATGGASALAAQQALRSKGRINTMEFHGTFEEWCAVPDKYALRMTLGPLRIREGYDGVTGWRTDLNSKKVTMLDGHDLERIQGDAYFENEMWARDDQGGGTVTLGPSSFRAGADYQSIDVKPPAGPSRRLWFNTKTGMLERVVTQADNGESTLWLSGFKPIGGRMRATLATAQDEAHRITFDPHEDADGERQIVDSARTVPSIDPAVFAAPSGSKPPATWLVKKGIAHVPFRYGTRHVWIRASINGGPAADFLLDTGCSMTAIDARYAEQAGIVPEGRYAVQGMGGLSQASFARVSSVRVGADGADGVALRDLKVSIVDLGHDHERIMWRRMAGLIGYDFLSRFVVEIDYDHEIVTFRDPDTFTYAGAGTALDMRLDSGVPVVRATLGESCSGDFLVDVGNFGFDLHGSGVRRCNVVQETVERKQVEVYGAGLGDVFRTWVCRIDSMALGPFAVREPIAALSLSRHGMVGSDDYSGNIGNSVLERFKVTFDYERKKLYLEPGERFTQRDSYSRSGALLVKLPSKVVAEGIVHGSAADDAGLKEDDEVVLINGRPALSFTPEELDQMFMDGEIGSTQTFTVQREGKKLKLSVKLHDVL